jgi:hypothetical protein
MKAIFDQEGLTADEKPMEATHYATVDNPVHPHHFPLSVNISPIPQQP